MRAKHSERRRHTAGTEPGCPIAKRHTSKEGCCTGVLPCDCLRTLTGMEGLQHAERQRRHAAFVASSSLALRVARKARDV